MLAEYWMQAPDDKIIMCPNVTRNLIQYALNVWKLTERCKDEFVYLCIFHINDTSFFTVSSTLDYAVKVTGWCPSTSAYLEIEEIYEYVVSLRVDCNFAGKFNPAFVYIVRDIAFLLEPVTSNRFDYIKKYHPYTQYLVVFINQEKMSCILTTEKQPPSLKCSKLF